MPPIEVFRVESPTDTTEASSETVEEEIKAIYTDVITRNGAIVGSHVLSVIRNQGRETRIVANILYLVADIPEAQA